MNAFLTNVVRRTDMKVGIAIGFAAGALVTRVAQEYGIEKRRQSRLRADRLGV